MIQHTIALDELFDRLNWRYATKKFDSNRVIPDNIWHVLEQSLVLSPSSFGLQPWAFFVIRNRDIRAQLVNHAFGQKAVADASHLIVLAIKTDFNEQDVKKYINRMAEVRDQPVQELSGLESTIEGFLNNPPFDLQLDKWAAKQVYLALGFFLYSAAMLGIDTCPMEGFVPEKFDEILDLTKQGYSSVVLCVAGYRSEDDKTASIRRQSHGRVRSGATTR